MNGPQKFRKQPVEVEAIQWTGKNPAAVRAFTGMHSLENGGEHFVFTTQSGHGELFVAANGVWMDIEVGEWIIRDARGFYPCKPDIFEQTYDRVPSFASGGVVPPGGGPFGRVPPGGGQVSIDERVLPAAYVQGAAGAAAIARMRHERR